MADIYTFTGIGVQECKLEDPIDARKDNFMKIALFMITEIMLSIIL